MTFLSSILLAFGLAMDAFAVSITGGIASPAVSFAFAYTNLDTFLITVIIALVSIVVNIFTNTFTYILALIQSIPYIGPMIANIITWPIFVTLNVVAYFVSLMVIRFKGISMVKDARIITTIFLLGLLLGFILGRIF